MIRNAGGESLGELAWVRLSTWGGTKLNLRPAPSLPRLRAQSPAPAGYDATQRIGS